MDNEMPWMKFDMKLKKKKKVILTPALSISKYFIWWDWHHLQNQCSEFLLEHFFDWVRKRKLRIGRWTNILSLIMWTKENPHRTLVSVQKLKQWVNATHQIILSRKIWLWILKIWQSIPGFFSGFTETHHQIKETSTGLLLLFWGFMESNWKKEKLHNFKKN